MTNITCEEFLVLHHFLAKVRRTLRRRDNSDWESEEVVYSDYNALEIDITSLDGSRSEHKTAVRELAKAVTRHANQSPGLPSPSDPATANQITRLSELPDGISDSGTTVLTSPTGGPTQEADENSENSQGQMDLFSACGEETPSAQVPATVDAPPEPAQDTPDAGSDDETIPLTDFGSGSRG
jgi:hypothetical protein